MERGGGENGGERRMCRTSRGVGYGVVYLVKGWWVGDDADSFGGIL